MPPLGPVTWTSCRVPEATRSLILREMSTPFAPGRTLLVTRAWDCCEACEVSLCGASEDESPPPVTDPEQALTRASASAPPRRERRLAGVRLDTEVLHNHGRRHRPSQPNNAHVRTRPATACPWSPCRACTTG